LILVLSSIEAVGDPFQKLFNPTCNRFPFDDPYSRFVRPSNFLIGKLDFVLFFPSLPACTPMKWRTVLFPRYTIGPPTFSCQYSDRVIRTILQIVFYPLKDSAFFSPLVLPLPASLYYLSHRLFTVFPFSLFLIEVSRDLHVPGTEFFLTSSTSPDKLIASPRSSSASYCETGKYLSFSTRAAHPRTSPLPSSFSIGCVVFVG